jgi:hypothetical protein
MRKQVFRSLLALTLLMSIVAVASAQTLPGSGWATTATFQNVGTAAATVSLTVQPLSTDGSTTQSVGNFTLDPGANKVFVPGLQNASGTADVTPALGNNFSGSMIVSSDQPVVAIGQLGNNQIPGTTLGVAGGYASAMYNGSDAISSILTYPTVKRNFGGKSTIFYAQAGSADVTFSAVIKTSDGVSHTKTGSIKQGRSVLLSPAEFTPAVSGSNCGTSPNISPCFGSLTITATGGNIVGAVVEFREGQAPATQAQSTSLFADTDASSTVYCPTFKNNFNAAQGRFTGISVGNAGATPVTVNLTLTEVLPQAGRTFQGTALTLQPGTSAVWSAQINNVGGFTNNGLGAAKITAPAGSKIVAVVNESNFAGVIKATTYSCRSAESATPKVAMPLVKENFPRGASSNQTGVSVQNVDTTATTVVATYVCAGVTYNVSSPTLQPGQGHTFFNVSAVQGGPPDNSNCGATLNGNGKKILAIAQESSDFDTPTAGLLDTKNYVGFNLAQ